MPNNNEIDDILNELKNKKQTNYSNNTTSDFEVKERKEVKEEIKSTDKIDINTQSNNFDLINDSFKSTNDIDDIFDDDYDDNENMKNKNPKTKKIIIAAIAVILIAAIAAAGFVIAKKNHKETEPETTTETITTTAAPVEKITNPLTGAEGFNKSAIGKRPVACVVENAKAARPQWGIDDSKNPPDIIVEAEVEGGETRMIWLYADYTALPNQIGPLRSARPPFIRFSQLFDCVFIHWGQSTSKGNYIGADSVFKSENVDHINQMAYSDKFNLFGRDSSRGVSSEHTGVLYGDKLKDAIEASGFRTEVQNSSFTSFKFNEKDTAVGETPCITLGLTFSKSTKTRDWTYNAEDKMYHSNDYMTDVSRKNILVLFDTTAYIVKENYKGSGNSETYCDYKLSGGTGKLASAGTVCDIKWSVENGVLVIKDTNGNDVSFNAGTTWIGWGSANNGGSVKTSQSDQENQ